MRKLCLAPFLVVLAMFVAPVVASDPRPPSTNEQVIRALFAAFNRHDLDALIALYTPDAYLMSSDFPAPRHGPEGVRKTYSELFAQFPSLHDEVKTIVVQGDQAAAEFVSSWKAEGKMPAGRLDVATFFKFKDGKIVSDVTYFNVPGPK